jgi:lipid-binding SYLF domain-containing protein
MRPSGLAVITVLSVSLLVGGCLAKPPATPEEASRAQALEAAEVVERARETVDAFAADPQFGPDFRGFLKRARGLFVAPQVYRGAFIVGAAGGNGLAVARDSRTGKWNGPAFYTLGEVSLGFQAGGEAAEVVLLAMSERGVSALLSPSVKLGADVGIAAGPVGSGAAVATMNLSADILSYSRARGLYAGASLQGAVVATRETWNRSYYARPVSPADILIRGDVRDANADPLIAAIEKAATTP